MVESINPKTHVVGIDLGGTKVEACLLDENRSCLERRRMPSEPSRGLNRVLDNIEQLVQKTAGRIPVAAYGIGTPGTYIEQEDRLYGSPHTPIYEEPGFIGRLRNRLSAPLCVENDANCLAIAEYFASCNGKYSHVLAVILGTGMGSGLILDGKLYGGVHGGAGEIGHTTVDINGRMCRCGRRGCAEVYLSGPSLSRRYLELSGFQKDVSQIYKLYRKGNPQAVSLIDESCRIMGNVLANVINTLDLEAVILGGGVSNLSVWYERVPRITEKNLFGIPRSPIPLLKAKLGDSAGVIGAAYLALRSLGLMRF